MKNLPQLNVSQASDILERLLHVLSGWKLVNGNPQEAPYTALQGPDDKETLGISLHDETRFGADLEERLPYSETTLFRKGEEVVSDETGLRIRWTQEKQIQVETKHYYEFEAIAEGPDFTCIVISIWSREPVADAIKEILKMNHWRQAVARHYQPIQSVSQVHELIERSDWLSLKMIKALEKCGSREAFQCADQFADFSRKIFQKKEEWPDLLAVVDYIIRNVPIDEWLDGEIDEFYEEIGRVGDPGKMHSPQLLKAVAKRKRQIQRSIDEREGDRIAEEALTRGDHLAWSKYKLSSIISIHLDAAENKWLRYPRKHITQLLSDLQTADKREADLATRVAALFSVDFPSLDYRVQINISLTTDPITGESQQTVTTPRLTLIRPSSMHMAEPTFSVIDADAITSNNSPKKVGRSLLITFLVEHEIELSEEAEKWILSGGEINPFESPESFDSYDTGFFTIEPRHSVLTNNNKYDTYYSYTDYVIANPCFLESTFAAHNDELRQQLVAKAVEQHNKAKSLDYDEETIVSVTGFHP